MLASLAGGKAKRPCPAAMKTMSATVPRRPESEDHRGPILVTHADAKAAPYPDPADDTIATRLHIVIADHLSADRLAIVGWFADPLMQVARVSIGVGTGAEVDLASHACLLVHRSAHVAFGAPPCVPVKFSFVCLLPGRSIDQADGLRVRLHGWSGETIETAVPAVGDASRLADIMADVPEADAFRTTEHLLGGWQRTAAESRRLPEPLEQLAERTHRRIDPRRNYGSTIGAPPAACSVDYALRVGTSGILMRGWLLHDETDTVEKIVLVSLSGRRVPLAIPLPAVARPDVLEAKPEDVASRNNDCGFVAFAAMDGLERDDALWFFEVILSGGTVKRVPFVCPPEPEPLQGIEAAVALAEQTACDLADLFARAVAPAVELFWSKTRQDGSEAVEIIHGSPPADAQVSVIVPLYGRIDFLRHQIAQFSNDPDFRAEGGIVDLIYVLDDPAKAMALRNLARIAHGVYGVPFRILLQPRNLGYAAASNAGAAIARGSLLLLLNSDVVPKTPRWIGRLARQYHDLDGCGVLGCRLLFEDGTIQHAGMTFEESSIVDGCWSNQHPGKGLSAAFDTEGGARRVPAVTGACMMIDHGLFDDLGGLSEDYVIGDFEDSDLCLKAYEAGFRSYYTPEVELYHLERQSMRLIGHGHAVWRQSLTLYNMWKQTQRWGELIPRILADLEPRSDTCAERHLAPVIPTQGAPKRNGRLNSPHHLEAARDRNVLDPRRQGLLVGSGAP
jgi:GT2 family glycosyltransferase